MTRYLATCILPTLDDCQLAAFIDRFPFGGSSPSGVAWLCGVISADRRRLICEVEATEPGYIRADVWGCGLTLERLTPMGDVPPAPRWTSLESPSVVFSPAIRVQA